MRLKLILCVLCGILFCNILQTKAQNTTKSSKEIEKLIAKKRAFNSKYGHGFRIQLYYGDETKARSLQSKFKLEFPKEYTNLNYDQPYWKVQIGNYKTRLDADKALLKFSEKFTGLIVVPLGK